MIKKSIGVLIVLVMLLPLLAACGAQGSAGPPGPPGAAGPAGPAAPQQLASITVIPANGTQQTPITVIGASFKPGEGIEVELIIGENSMLIGYREKIEGAMKEKHVADEFGTFKVVSAIPTSAVAPPGVYTIKVTGDKGSVALAPFQVIE